MKVVLLGNGYDLNYLLPTKYINFLNVTSFLVEKSVDGVSTVGDVFGNETLLEIDRDIKRSYEAYKSAYDSAPLPEKALSAIKSLRENVWFAYLLKSFNKDIGWIDFEKEINKVIEIFQDLIDYNKTSFNIENFSNSPISAYVIERFNIFLSAPQNYSHIYARSLKSEYRLEEPKGSRNWVINKERMVETLDNALKQLAEALKVYLHYFVEGVVRVLVSEGRIKQLPELSDANTVITFNYTDTYEIMSPYVTVYHIHGKTSGDIVLGINSNSDDNLATAKTDFICFKKYFQRVFYETDSEYLETVKIMQLYKSRDCGAELYVMGHSLDVTDRDVLAEMFELASKITILYHDKKRVSAYIANLVAMFGKETFDEWRLEKGLCFVEQQ